MLFALHRFPLYQNVVTHLQTFAPKQNIKNGANIFQQLGTNCFKLLILYNMTCLKLILGWLKNSNRPMSAALIATYNRIFFFLHVLFCRKMQMMDTTVMLSLHPVICWISSCWRTLALAPGQPRPGPCGLLLMAVACQLVEVVDLLVELVCMSICCFYDTRSK